MTTVLYFTFVLSLTPYLILFAQIVSSLWIKKVSNKEPTPKKEFSAPVSFILTCYNEEKHFFRKINSLLDEQDWIEGSEIIIVSGGSTDSTDELLKTFENHPFVQLHRFEKRVSKIAGINYAVKFAKNDFFVFSDFRQEMKPGSVHILMNNFSDPQIGTVTATLVDSKNASQPSFARSLMNKMGWQTSQHSSCLSIFGALYAQRKTNFREIPEDLLFDDLYVTASVLGQDTRLIQEKNAIIYDFNFLQYYDKERMMRLTRGLLLFLFLHFDVIRKIPFRLRIQFLIFKYMKLLFPFSLLLLMVSLTLLLALGEYLVPFAVAFCTVLFLSIPATQKILLQTLKFHFYFGLAIVRYISGRERSVFWEKLKIDR
ncbi:MAG: glycosyltransferase [Crocinitomicaceae bacterium]